MFKLLVIFPFFFFSDAFGQRAYTVMSPDTRIRLKVSVTDSVHWQLYNRDEILVKDAVTAMKIKSKSAVGIREKIAKVTVVKKRQLLNAVVPVLCRKIKDYYNELIIQFRSGNRLYFRAYDNGVAYRWQTAFKDHSIEVENEIASLRYPYSNRVFWGSDKENEFLQSHYELVYKDTVLSSFRADQLCALPLYLETPRGTKLLLSESDLFDYPNMFLYGTGSNEITAGFPKVIKKEKLIGDRGIKVIESAGYIAKTNGSRNFPWRLVMLANDDKDLIENNLVYQLAAPNILKGIQWIKPGKVAWDWWNDNNISGVDFKSGLNTETYKYYIDFASRFGLEYIILDEGWSRSTWDLLHPRAEIDIAELVAYGKRKNVGLILWTLWQPLDKDMDAVLKTYSRWGVKGVKVDFMARADQYMVNFYERVAEKAAGYKLLLDLHGAYKPVGLNRKYPNILSYEGVKGLENYKWTDEEANPYQDVIIPFTRMVLGAMDYTPGAMRNVSRKNFHANYSTPMSEGTRAHQVAMYAVYASPLQMLSDSPTNYLKDTACTRYIAGFPTVWDTTVALDGKIGAFVAIARKHQSNWYLGALTNWSARDISIALDFLSANKKYTIKIFADGINADRFPEDYTIREQKVRQGDVLKVKMQPGGGWAAIIKTDE